MVESTYNRKRDFTETPEPAAEWSGVDVDPMTAPVGELFVIHQHYATRLHHDLRLEMFNGSTPVLVSWALPKLLPRPGERHLAVRTEDHPYEYATFTGSIPEGYGAGEVRIFDTGTYRALERETKKITIELLGERIHGTYHLIRTRPKGDKEQWLALQGEDLRPAAEPHPPANPMLATSTATAFDDAEWNFEPKWDGVRAIALCGDGTKLISRRNHDVTAAYPELAGLHTRLVAVDAWLDGEIVAFEYGVPSFQKLQGRMHLRDAGRVEKLAKKEPVVFMAFDMLYLDGRSLIDMELSERRRLLEETVVPSERLQVSPAIVGDGVALFAAASDQKLEGIVAKRLDSPYVPGARSTNWLKIKTVLDADAVVVGWTEGGGNRLGTLGALLLAMYDEGELRYVGNVGTGFNGAVLEELMERLTQLPVAQPPFAAALFRERPELRKAHWVEPQIVATIEYRQVTAAGRLRVPSFKGFRADKAPTECTFDQLSG